MPPGWDGNPQPPIDDLLIAASQRSTESLREAEALLESGYASAALVWAVRAVEIFMKELVLTPLFLAEAEGKWFAAMRKADRLFGASNWKRAMRRVEDVVGTLDPMLTEDGKDAYAMWVTTIVRLRGDVVHGKSAASTAVAAWAVEYALQLMQQMLLRLMLNSGHPLSDILRAALAGMRKSLAPEAQ